VNAKAMEASGITKSTPDPKGGEILHDPQGNPTGLLRELAAGLASSARAEWESRRSSADLALQRRKAIDLAIDECLSKGITTFQDAGSPFITVDTLKRMADNRELRLRIWMMLRTSNAELAPKLDAYKMDGYGGGYLSVRAIKRQIDGALGSRGAWL